jgi:hypothetical protein
MPCLNSTNSLDWQMGSYAVPKKDKADKPVKARKRADHDDDDDIPNFR